MERHLELERLQKSFRVPAGLSGSRPRDVVLTGGGRALFGLAIALFAGGLLGAILMAGVIAREQNEARELRERGVNAVGQVVRAWRGRGDDKPPMVRYRFQAGHAFYERDARLPLRLWRTLEAGSEIGVRYLPGRPGLSHPACCPPRPKPAFLPYLIAGIAFAAGLGALAALAREKRLLEWGRAAAAQVTSRKKTQHGHVIEYDFAMLSGAIAHGKSGPEKKPFEIGTTITVVYDPDNPSRNARYPFSLVKPREA